MRSLRPKTNQQQVSFIGQSQGEQVLLLVRRHPLVLSPRLLAVVLLCWLPWIVFVVGVGFSALFAVLFLLTLIGGGLYSYVVWSDWYNTLYLVTNQRVITTWQHNLWRRAVREVPLDKIQEVRHDQRGLFKIALRVGDVIVRTAGAELHLVDVGNPYQIEQRVGSLIHHPHTPKRAERPEF